MRKSFNTYLVIWAIALILFNLVIFVIPSSIDGKTILNVVKTARILKGGMDTTDISLTSLGIYLVDNKLVLDKYAGAFWPSYVCVMFAFIGQLVCAIFAFKETNNQKFFYKIPLITISYTGLIFTLIFGIIGMFFPEFPIWLAVAICVIIFVITLIALLKANLAATIISNKDDEIAESTAFMKEMTAKAKALWDADKQNDDLRKLYEAFRYANPVLKEGSEELINNVNNLFEKIKDNKSFDDIKELVKLLNEKK